MSFYRAFCHIVWSTKYRSALLTPDIEPFAHDVMRSKAIQLGAIVFALNGTENHVHLVSTFPMALAVSEFVGQVKGITTYKINREGKRSVPFAWQNDFSFFTFDEKRLPNYVGYVERQKEHHAQNHIIPILERTEDNSSNSIHEIRSRYSTEDLEWWNEMLAL